MEFAERLKQLRKNQGYTQGSLAKALGVSTGSVAMWETAKRSPDYEMLNKISDLLNRRIDYILGFSDDNSPRDAKTERNQNMVLIEVNRSHSEVFEMYKRLDKYGKRNVDELIIREFERCKEQRTATF